MANFDENFRFPTFPKVLRVQEKFLDEKILFRHPFFPFVTDLSEWNRDHVRIWLKSVSQMFELEMPKVQKFPQTGQQLSSLSR